VEKLSSWIDDAPRSPLPTLRVEPLEDWLKRTLMAAMPADEAAADGETCNDPVGNGRHLNQ
jgi:hypothetical protein